MTKADMDYEAMKLVLCCESRRQVQDVLIDYKETYFRDLIHTKQKLAQRVVAYKKSHTDKTLFLVKRMSSAGTSPAGVGASPSILARALPSPLSRSYSWPSPTGFESDNDPLLQYVANLSPGVGTNATPPIVNSPPSGMGTP